MSINIKYSTRQDADLFAGLLQDIHSLFNISWLVSSSNSSTQTRETRWDSGGDNRQDEQVLFLSTGSQAKAASSVPHRMGTMAVWVSIVSKPRLFQSIDELIGVFRELLHPPGLIQDDLEGLVCSGSLGGG
jgi:hypothetical protein